MERYVDYVVKNCPFLKQVSYNQYGVIFDNSYLIKYEDIMSRFFIDGIINEIKVLHNER